MVYAVAVRKLKHAIIKRSSSLRAHDTSPRDVTGGAVLVATTAVVFLAAVVAAAERLGMQRSEESACIRCKTSQCLYFRYVEWKVELVVDGWVWVDRRQQHTHTLVVVVAAMGERFNARRARVGARVSIECAI